MAPKTNAKKEAGRARKAETEEKKKGAANAEKEKKEAAAWEDGAKSSKAKEDKEAKKAAEAARKAENARLLALEEASLPSKAKAAPKAGTKKSTITPRPAGPGAIAAGGGLNLSAASGSNTPDPFRKAEEEIESFSATGLDNALDMLSLVNAKTDKASVGQQAAKIEAHPERRFKAAYNAYEERELPLIRKNHPGLRLQQYKELLYKQFQKSPENPFNQTTISYDATKEDKVAALTAHKEQMAAQLREKTN